MDELMSRKASPEETEKWLGLNPEIVVTGTKEKPLYHIVYFDPSDKMVHIGFSSYKLDFVFDWLKGYFGQDRATISDREPEAEKQRVHANADRIRAMSDEELAKVPAKFGYSCVFPDRECGEDDKCEKCLLELLQQPAEEEKV